MHHVQIRVSACTQYRRTRVSRFRLSLGHVPSPKQRVRSHARWRRSNGGPTFYSLSHVLFYPLQPEYTHIQTHTVHIYRIGVLLRSIAADRACLNHIRSNIYIINLAAPPPPPHPSPPLPCCDVPGFQAHSKDEIYPLPLESGVVLEFRQLQAGEVTGLGTGATVWPAAHVLAKYLELRFGRKYGTNNAGSLDGGGGMAGLRAVDLGSGTGVAGIVAAALGAEAFLTDQEQLLFLMRENADRATSNARAKSKSQPGTSKALLMDGEPGANTGVHAAVAADPTTADATPTPACGDIRVLTYDWGMDDDLLSPPVDVVLVSDCVLPKLYPIEPLVDAIDRLSGPETVTIMSYEHRHYQAFDPRRKFDELAAAKGLVKSVIPQAQQHPIFSADDIEIWEVRRRRRQEQQEQQEPQRTDNHGQRNAASVIRASEGEPVSEEVLGADNDVEIFSTLSPKPLSSPSSCGEPPGAAGAAASSVAARAAAKDEVRTVTSVGIMGERHDLAQAPSGAIGCYLWPSAVVMARHLLTTSPAAATGTVATGAAGSSNSSAGEEATEDGGLLASAGATAGQLSCAGGARNQYPPQARALELGSGVGLVAMTAAMLGWEVVGTDKSDALPLLELNTSRCLTSTRREWGFCGRGWSVKLLAFCRSLPTRLFELPGCFTHEKPHLNSSAL